MRKLPGLALSLLISIPLSAVAEDQANPGKQPKIFWGMSHILEYAARKH
ncbi:MAG: hypothetical protein QOK36_4391 [Gaiellales bacterium]|jgi:hypothetical protein|nr:hypothetical protein [Gaiellales bacterium]